MLISGCNTITYGRYLFATIFLLILVFTFPQNLLGYDFSKQDTVELASLRTPDKWLGEDKWKHFMISSFISSFTYKFFRDGFNNKKEDSILFSSGITLSLGIGKEIKDRRKPKGRFSYKDLVFDVLGTGLGIFLVTR